MRSSGYAELKSRLLRPRPGGVVLFTGAGFSVGAKNVCGEQIPMARAFARELCSEIGLGDDAPLTLAAELYSEAKCNERAFLELLRSKFTTTEVQDYHKAIISYPWKRIYTTNYDNVAEYSLTGLRSFDRNTTPFAFEADGTQIVHVNGSVGSLTSSSTIDDFQLTLSQYMARDLFQTPWASTLRSDFRLAHTIVFIGYSMYDTDISKIIYNDPALREKTFLIQRSDLGGVEEKHLSRFGSLVKIELVDLGSDIEDIKSSGGPVVDKSKPENFVELSASPQKNERLTVSDVEQLLERGIFRRDVFLGSVDSASPVYVVNREAVNRICDRIVAGERQVLIHAGMGNGKTIAVELLARKLISEHGYRVFLFSDELNSIAYDIDALSCVNDKYVLIFEGLFSNQDVIEQFRSQLSNAVILVTERSSSFDLRRGEIAEIFPDQYAPFDINKLERKDVEKLVGLLNSGAYWAEFERATSNSSKMKLIETRCASEFSSVCLGIVKSKTYLSELSSSLKGCDDGRSQSEDLELIVAALLLSFINVPAPYWLISELIGRDMYSVAQSITDQKLREYFIVGGDHVSARSPIFSELILRELFSDDFVVRVMLKILRASSDRHKRSRIFRTINSRIMQFKNIERVIKSEANAYSIIRSFYFDAGDIGYKDFSPPYWAQFAIAARAFEDYVPADRYFKEAQRIALSRQDYYQYKIDNAYAQFLLESRSRTDHWSDYFDAFREASRLAFSQITIRQAGNYPYKVIEKFSDFFAARAGDFSKRQRADCREECLKWLEHLDGLAPTKRRLEIVRMARTSVSLSLDEIDAADM